MSDPGSVNKEYINKYFRKCVRMKGVQNVVAFNSDGIIKRSTFKAGETTYLIGLVQDLIAKVVCTIKLIDNGDAFYSMRLRTHKFEIFITKDSADLYFIVFQNAKGKSGP